MKVTAEEGRPQPGGTHASRRQAALALVLLALSARLLHLNLVRDTPAFGFHLTFAESDMHMFDQWARRIVAGDILGRETHHPLYRWQLASAPLEQWREWYGSRPVFYKAPFYPYLLATLQATFGDAMLPVVVLQVLAAAASVLLVLRVTGALLGWPAALGAAALLALYAPAIHFDVVMLRGPWIVLTVLLATWRLVRARERPDRRNAFLLGLALGAALLVNEGAMALAALAAVFLAKWCRRPGPAAVALGTLALGASLALAPVFLRNVAVGAPPFKLAVTGSIVYSVFNSAGSSPYFLEFRPAAFLPPLQHGRGGLWATAVACLGSFPGPLELVHFYLRKSAGLVAPFENPDNANFYHAALRDPVLGLLPGYGVLLPLAVLGLGLAVWRRSSLAPLLPAMLSLLLALLLTLPLSRFRVVFAVFLMPAAGLTLAQVVAWLRARRYAPVLACLALALGVAWLARSIESSVIFQDRPRGSLVYRASEFELATRYYEGRGMYGTAVREALDLARLNPEPSVRSMALFRAAGLQARRGDTAAVREALNGARDAWPDDPETLLAAGDLYLELLGDPAAARDCYRDALALAPVTPLRNLATERLHDLDQPGSAVQQRGPEPQQP